MSNRSHDRQNGITPTASQSGSLLVRREAEDANPLTDHDLLRAVSEREDAIKRSLGLLSKIFFVAEVNASRRQQAGQLIRDLLSAEAEVARFRLSLMVVGSKRAAYLDHVRSQQWVAQAIVRHEIEMADKLDELYFGADEVRDYEHHKRLESIKRRQALGVIPEDEAARKINQVKELARKKERNTLDTIDRLLTDHRRYLSDVHERLAEDFRK